LHQVRSIRALDVRSQGAAASLFSAPIEKDHRPAAKPIAAHQFRLGSSAIALPEKEEEEIIRHHQPVKPADGKEIRHCQGHQQPGTRSHRWEKQGSANRQEQTDLTAKVISTLCSPLAPAALALSPDARDHERERLMGRILRPIVGPLRNSITVSKPPRRRPQPSRRRRRRARRGPWLAPAAPDRAS